MGLIMAEGGRLLYFLTGSVITLPVAIEWDNTELAVVLRDVYDFIIPLPIGLTYTMTARDMDTGATLFEGQPAPPATTVGGVVHLQSAVTDDKTPPYVIGGSPLSLSSWRVGSAKGNIRDKIRFVASDADDDGVADTTGDLTISGDAESLPKDTYVAVRNNKSGEVRSVSAAADGSFSVSVPYTFADPVTLLISSVDVESGETFRFNFSEPILAETPGGFDYSEIVELYESQDVNQKIRLTTQVLTSQTLEIRPEVNLKSNTDYTIALKQISDLVPNQMIGDFKVQFKTRAYTIIGGASSGTVNDTLLIRDHLLVGKDSGIEIYSTGNPFEMGTPVHTMQLGGGVRSFAKIAPCIVGTQHLVECVVAVGGGVAPTGGVLRVFDFTDFGTPIELSNIILTRFVGDVGDDQLGENNPIPEGRPIKVVVNGSTAYVATIGVGLQVIDLAHIQKPVYDPLFHKRYDEPNLKDIALYYTSIDDPATPADESRVDIGMSGSSMHEGSDLVSFKAVDPNPTSVAFLSRVKSSVIPGTANNIEILQGYEVDIDQDGRTGAAEDSDDALESSIKVKSRRSAGQTDPRTWEVHDLAFITGLNASSKGAIHVIDITDIRDPHVLGSIQLSDGAFPADLKLDPVNMRLYVPVGADGIYIVDIKDPFLVNPTSPPQVIGKIQIGNTITDGNVTVDAELNTVYVATRDSGLKSVMVGNFNMEVVTDVDSDGKYEHVGVIQSEGVIANHNLTDSRDDSVIEAGKTIPPGIKLSDLQASDPIKYYVLAFLPSSAGGTANQVKVKLTSTNFFDQPEKLGAGYPDTEFETVLKYKAPTDTNNDSYRVFLSDPFYITAHPELPKADKMDAGAKLIAAGDFIQVDIDEQLSQQLGFVTTNLLRQSRTAARALRMELQEGEKPEQLQNPPASAETPYPPYLHSGEWTHAAVDFAIKGRGMDYAFARRYKSQILYDGPLGNGWDHAYFARLQELPNNDVLYFDGMGHREFFHFKGEEDPRCKLPEGDEKKQCYDGPAGEFALLKKKQDGTFLLLDPDSTQFYFSGYGQLAYIQDRNENYMEMLYNPAGQLAIVIDTMGRPIAYAYNEDGKLEGVRDFTGREWKLKYDEGVASPDPDREVNALTSVEAPPTGDGNPARVVRYGYTTPQSQRENLPDLNLKSIKSPKGDEFLVNQYNDDDQLFTQKVGTPSLEFTYSEDPLITVKDRNENEIKYTLDDKGRTTSVTVPGSENATFVTSYQYNDDGLLTKVNAPEGGITEYQYDEENELRRSQANLLSQTTTPDPREGSDPLTVSFEYDDTFNQVTSATNARGNVISTELDNNGNAVQVDSPIDGIVEKYEYNTYGQVSKHTDPIGNSDSYEYFSENESAPSDTREGDNVTGGYLKKAIAAATSAEAEGQLSAAPVEQQYEYDERGNVTSYADGRGVEHRSEFDDLDELTGTTRAFTGSNDGATALGYRADYKYDPNGNLIETVIPKNLSAQESSSIVEYDALNRQIKVKQKAIEKAQEVELVTSYEYDGNGNVKNVKYPKGGTSTTGYSYDARNLVTSRLEAEDSPGKEDLEFSYTYDKDGNLTQETTPDIVILHQYDGLGREIQTVFGERNYVEKTYDNNSNVKTLEVKDASSRVYSKTESNYDALDRVTRKMESIILPDGTENGTADTKFVYDSNSRVTDSYDALDNHTHMVYDALGRLRQQIDAEENAVEMTYDGNGNMTEKKQIDKVEGSDETHTWKYHYDAANRLGIEETPDGKTRVSSYDERDNLRVSIDERGVLKEYTHDGMDRMLSAHEPSISSKCDQDIEYSYDGNSNMTSYKDPCGQTTRYNYDSVDRLRTVTYPGLAQELKQLYKYQDYGTRLELYTDRMGNVVEPTYDANNRIKKKQIVRFGQTAGTTIENFTYDPLDRIVRAQDDDSTVEMEYNSLGHVLAEVQDGTRIAAEYDKLGNRTALQYPNGMVVTSQYDLLNRPTNFYADSVLLSSQDYAGPSRMKGMEFGNQTKGAWSYDSKKRIQEIAYQATGGGTFDGRHLSYDDADNKTARTHLYRPQYIDSYQYSQQQIAQLTFANQLRPQTGPDGRIQFAQATETFDVDKANEINRYVDADLPRTYTINERHEVTGIEEGTKKIVPLSDLNGNLVQERLVTSDSDPGKLLREITYDYTNHPVSIRRFNEQGQETKLVVYRYDALGRRIAKSVDHGPEVHYINFGKDTIEEMDDSGIEIASYIYRGIDQPVSMIRNTTDPTERTLYYHTDDAGNVSSLTNEAGEVVERYFYKAYGQFAVTADTEPPEVSRITATATGLDVLFSEEMNETSLTSIEVNGGSISRTGQFTDEAHATIRWTFQQTPPAGTSFEIKVSDQARDLSMRKAVPITTNVTFTPGVEIYTALDPDKYTGEKIIPESRIGNQLTYHGARYDPEPQLFYQRARYFDPSRQRFLSVDPLGVSQGPNPYAGYGGNPLSKNDPDGKAVSMIIGCDASDPRKFYDCARNQVGEDEALSAYYGLYDTKALQLAPDILAAGVAIDIAARIYITTYAALLSGFGALEFFSSALTAETLASYSLSEFTPRLLSAGVSGLAIQGTDDVIDWRFSGLAAYGKSALYAMGGEIAGEGIAALLRGFKPSAPRIENVGSGTRRETLRQRYSEVFAEYKRFRQQGFTPAQAKYLTEPYEGWGHHFVPRRWKRVPHFYMESRVNIMKPPEISIGRFYERHFLGDPKFRGTAFPRRIGGSWSGRQIGLQKPGFAGYFWYGSPRSFKIAAASVTVGTSGALYWYLSEN